LKVRIAAVEPVFTTTAYSSFYNFYSKYSSKVVNGPIRTELNLLNASLVHGWGWSEGLHRFLASKTAGQQYDIVLGRNLSFISEVDVTQGILFGADGTRNYDVVILGFTEYVTSQEYYAYKSFVATGGLLVLLDATNFLAEVQYYPRTQHLALIRGHGWGFNGTMAKRDIFDRWQSEDSNWIGSTFGLGSTSEASYNGAMPLDHNFVGRALKEKYGHRVFTSYHGHEENIVSNFTRTSIIAHWVHTGKRGLRPNVCAYLHYYRSSYVAHLGVMGSDVIETDESVQFFLAQIILFAARQSKETGNVVYSMGPFQVSFHSNQGIRIVFNGKGYLNGETGTYPYGNILASSNPPAGYSFDGWNVSGGVVVDDPTANPATIIITGPGSLGANFRPTPSDDVAMIYRRDRRMSFLLLGAMLLISFSVGTIMLRKRWRGITSTV
jgi:hypothetical protein